MSTIKAIQTWYDGVLYRSRAEARTAVFFNTAGINFEYEREGYKLSTGECYLPDFHLPDIAGGVYLEVKPTYPLADEISKAEGLAGDTYKAVFIQYGEVGVRPDQLANDSMTCVGPHGVIDSQFWFCQCEYCGLIGIQWQGHADRLECGCHAERGNNKVQGHDSPTLIQAYAAARSARFEFGQSGSMIGGAA